MGSNFLQLTLLVYGLLHSRIYTKLKTLIITIKDELLPSKHEMDSLIYLFMDGSSTFSSLDCLSCIVLL